MRKTATAARAAALLPAVALLLIIAATAAIRSEDSGKLRKINISTEGDHLFVKLTGSSRFRYRVKTEENPPRMTIQLYNTTAELGYNSLDVNQGYVKDVKIQESTVNGQRATFVILHLNQNVAIDYGLSGDGRTMYVSTPTYAGAGKGSVSDYSAEPYSAPAKTSQQQEKSAQPSAPSSAGLPPEITIPGGAPTVKQTQSEMVPYAGSSASPVSTAGGFTDFSQNRGPDNSPYIVGPVILQDADVSKAVQLLSEAAGGASIIVESAVLEAGGKSAAGGSGGITMTLSHITLEDALDVITSANGWVWKKIAGSYLIVSKETANQGLEIIQSATAFDLTNDKMQISLYKPKYIDACTLLGYVKYDVPASKCDPYLNYIMLKGRFEDIERGKSVLAQVDTSKNLNAAKTDKQVTEQLLNKTAQDLATHIVRLKYIRAEEIQSQLTALMKNPFFGNLSIVVDRIYGGAQASNENSMNTLTIDTGSNTLIFVGREEIFRRLQQVIQSLDVPFSATVIKTIQFKNTLVDDFKYDMGDKVSSSLGRQTGTSSNSTGGSVLYNRSTNSITFIGTEDNYNRLMQIVQAYDTDEKALVTEYLPFTNMKVMEVLKSGMLNIIIDSPYYGFPKLWDTNVAEKSTYSTDPPNDKKGLGGHTLVTANVATNSFIIVAQKLYLDRIKELLKSLDIDDKRKTARLVKIKHISGLRAINIIEQMMNINKIGSDDSVTGKAVMKGDFFDCPTPDLGTLDTSKETGGVTTLELDSCYTNYSQVGRVIFTTSIPSKEAADPNRRFNVVSLSYESTQNAIMVNANDIDYKRILEILTLIDVPFPQIKIDVQVVEVSDNDLKDISRLASYTDNKSSADSTKTKGELNFIYDTSQDLTSVLIAKVNMLITNERASIIANPSIITRENVFTTFQYQDKYWFAYDTWMYDKNGYPYLRTVRDFLNYGPRMGLIAHANLDSGTVLLHLWPQYNTLKGLDANGMPITSASNMDQEVVVKSGDTVISSGFISNSESESDQKVPVLGNLPLIGTLFKSKKNTTVNKQVLFLITPTIMPAI